MTSQAPTTGPTLLQRSNGGYVPYQFKSHKMAGIAARVFSKYKELKAIPEPAQNPYGLREPDLRAVELAVFIYKQLGAVSNVAIAKEFDASRYGISCPNEDGFLKTAVVSPPPMLDWAPENGNRTELANMGKKPDRLLATMQHFLMVARMADHGTFVLVIEHDPDAKQMVFTRDSAFAVDGTLFLAKLFRKDRAAETAKFTGSAATFSEGAVIEGGNVILGKDCIFLGINHRTNMAGYEELRGKTGREVIPLPISDEVIHLDCIFLPKEANGGPSLAFFYPKMFREPQKAHEIISKRYGNVKVISDSEFKAFGANVLKLDSSSWLANPGASAIVSGLEKAGIKPDLLHFDQISMSEAGFRCCFAAVARLPAGHEAVQ